MFYTVFSTNDSPYMQWQSELLEYSWKRVGQEGALVRLVATDDPARLPAHRYARSFATKLWDTHPATGDAYAPYNKPASLLEWVFADRPEGTVLLLDPDCMFRQPVERRVAPGHPVSQAWVDYTSSENRSGTPFGLGPGFAFLSEHCVDTEPSIEPVMIPTLIHTRDLRMICARWLQLCGVVRDNYRDSGGKPAWESDMFSYLAACAEYGLWHEPATLGVCTNWEPAKAPDAPIIHYCQSILGKDGSVLFDKRRYVPWTRVETSLEPLHSYGSDLISLVNAHVEEGSGGARALTRDDRPRRADGIMEGRVLDDMLLERPADGMSIWISPSAGAIWDLCDGSLTIGEIGIRLAEEFDASEAIIAADVLTTVERLREIEFIELI
jgi:hypothetical protein